jgi:Asp-tRNA(Asn)/Glu-tRNA(Gln) amidotransferase B subunit
LKDWVDNLATLDKYGVSPSQLAAIYKLKQDDTINAATAKKLIAFYSTRNQRATEMLREGKSFKEIKAFVDGYEDVFFEKETPIS